MRKVSIDFLKQQVRTFWVESWEVRVFLWGGVVPPHVSDLDRGPPWGLSSPVPLPLLILLFLLLFFLYCVLSHSGRMALPVLTSSSVGGWGVLSAAYPCIPSPPSPPVPATSPSPPPSAASSPVPSGMFSLLLVCCRGLATMWVAPRQEINDPIHDGSGLFFWRPPPP